MRNILIINGMGLLDEPSCASADPVDTQCALKTESLKVEPLNCGILDQVFNVSHRRRTE